MRKDRLDWRIRYRGVEYKIQRWGRTFVIEIDHGQNHTVSSRITKDKKLRRLIEMWGNTEYDMLPGEFINKVTGCKCQDLI